MLSVALPTLARVLHALESDLQWFSPGYFLVLTAAMLPAVQADFARGMDMALLVSADIALAGIIFTLLFLPASNAPKKAAQPVRRRGCREAAGKYRSGCVNAKWRRPWPQCAALRQGQEKKMRDMVKRSQRLIRTERRRPGSITGCDGLRQVLRRLLCWLLPGCSFSSTSFQVLFWLPWPFRG